MQESTQARIERLEARVLELERRLAQLDGTPAPSQPQTAHLTRLLDDLLTQAPSKLARTIGPTCREARELSLQEQPEAGDRLASASFDKTVRIWDVDRPSIVRTLDLQEDNTLLVTDGPTEF